MRFFLILICILAAYSQKIQKTAIIHGDKLAYQIEAPNGWLLDIYSGLNEDLPAVLYQPGSNWKTATTVMYTNVAYIDDQTPTLQSVINADISKFKSKSNDIVIEQQASIEFPDIKKEALVYYYLDPSNSQFEAVAYLQESKIVMMFVLASKTEANFFKSINSFTEFTLSCIFLTDKVGGSEPPKRKKN